MQHSFVLDEVRLNASTKRGGADGGGERDRTDDLLRAKQALSQLSYTPVTFSIAPKLDRAGGPGRT